MTDLLDMKVQLKHMTHDARRILKGLRAESEAMLFDQMTVMTWCFNYGVKKTFSILNHKYEELGLREAIMATNEEREFIQHHSPKIVPALQPEDLEGKSPSEVAKLVRAEARRNERTTTSKRMELRKARFDDHIALNMLTVDRDLLVSDYNISSLDQLFEMLQEISKEELEEFIQTFKENCTMWIFEHRLEAHLGSMRVAEEILAGYERFQKSEPVRQITDNVEGLVQKMNGLLNRLKGRPDGSR